RYLKFAGACLENDRATATGEANKAFGGDQRNEFGELDVFPGDFALADPRLLYAGLGDARFGYQHVAGEDQQANKADDDAAGDQGTDVLADGAGGRLDNLHGDKQQDAPGKELDPFRPGHAFDRQWPQLGKQLIVLFEAGPLRKHAHYAALRAASALPARLDDLRPKWPDIHMPISTTASRSTPVSMPRPC